MQGTINGFGERCGNANLVSLIPTLQLKRGWRCVTPAQLAQAGRRCRAWSTSSRTWSRSKRQAVRRRRAPSRTRAACTSSAVQKNAETYEHIDPALVGNAQRVLVSDLSGRSNLLAKAARVRHRPREREPPRCSALLDELKELEAQGYAFEGADASFELLMRKALEGEPAALLPI